MSWLENLKASLRKMALDKLSDDELSEYQLPSPNDDANQEEVPDNDPNPMAWNNKYVVKTGDTSFIVELSPKIMNQDNANGSGDVGGGNNQPTNPDANPALLQQWLNSSSEPTKPISHIDQGTEDPISREEEGLSPNPRVQVHKQASINIIAENEIDPGIDKSNPKMPCKVCENYIAETGECNQGLDPIKVQSAGSCSWLNANMRPYGKPTDPDLLRKDEDIVNSDISKNTNNGDGEKSHMINQNIN